MQRWIGDFVDIGPGRFHWNRVCVPMSTAIFRTYTREGFVIAADGRACGAQDGDVVSEETQKIFPIGGGTKPSLAYSISGAATLASRDETEVAFDFVKEINRATEARSLQRHSHLADYARKAFSAVHRGINDSKLAGRLDYPEPETLDQSERGYTIARVFIDGYFKGVPSRVKVRFFHEDQTLAPLEVLQQELVPGAPWYQGPEKVFESMFEADGGTNEILSAYGQRSREIVSHPNEVLRVYAQMGHAFIKACDGPEARAMDPKGCAQIGGHVHVATITPKDGFRWVPGCEPITSN